MWNFRINGIKKMTMPLYHFKGIDAFGTIHRRKLNAPTEKHLDDLLLSEGIIILSKKPAHRLYIRFITIQEKITFYQNLTQLLKSGILLHDALEYIALNSKNIFFQDSIYDLSKKVSSGQSFAQALSTASAFTSSTINFMIHAGQQAGHLERTCDAIATYLEQTKNFKKDLLSALFIPLVTFIVLILLVCIISQMMLPRLFAMIDLFKNKKIQLKNRLIFKILQMINMKFFAYFFGIFLLVLFFCFLINKTKYGRIMLHRFILKIPLINTVLIYGSLNRIFFMLSLLLKNGTTITESLVIINQISMIEPIKVRLCAMTDSIKNGMMFSTSLQRFFGIYDTYASLMIRVAEKSGTVGETCESIAKEYNSKIKKIVGRIIMIIQPTMIITLGIFIALLMIAIYAPLLEFSMTI